MKSLMTRWKPEPSNPKPFSPVERARKFSTVFGTDFPYKPIVILPAASPLWPAEISIMNSTTNQFQTQFHQRTRIPQEKQF